MSLFGLLNWHLFCEILSSQNIMNQKLSWLPAYLQDLLQLITAWTLYDTRIDSKTILRSIKCIMIWSRNVRKKALMFRISFPKTILKKYSHWKILSKIKKSLLRQLRLFLTKKLHLFLTIQLWILRKNKRLSQSLLSHSRLSNSLPSNNNQSKKLWSSR